MIDPDTSIRERHEKSTTKLNQGTQLNDTLDTSNSSCQDYAELGKFYKDPSTGKLIMVEG